jgi:hypothetical protein
LAFAHFLVSPQFQAKSAAVAIKTICSIEETSHRSNHSSPTLRLPSIHLFAGISRRKPILQYRYFGMGQTTQSARKQPAAIGQGTALDSLLSAQEKEKSEFIRQIVEPFWQKIHVRFSESFVFVQRQRWDPNL